MASLMGTETILCGMQPGVAASLVDLDVHLEDLNTSLNLNAALANLAARESADRQIGLEEESANGEEVDGSPRDEALDRQ
jgi:rsbT antagonist protein RsbS